MAKWEMFQGPTSEMGIEMLKLLVIGSGHYIHVIFVCMLRVSKIGKHLSTEEEQPTSHGVS